MDEVRVGWGMLLIGAAGLFTYRKVLFFWTVELVEPALQTIILATGKALLWASLILFGMSEKLVSAVKPKKSIIARSHQ